MPYYYHLQYMVKAKEEQKRAVDNLLTLRKQLDKEVPGKDADNNLLLATWNIRDFGKARPKHGKRLPESWFYIAEVISRFDFVAVQEVNELDEWEEVMDILGPDWDYIATDVTDTKLGGNGERLTYVYDKRKVWFQNIAGEIVLPADMLISKVEVTKEEKKKKMYAGKQFHRTPFFASFQAGWFKFDICTVHLYFGADTGDKLQERVEEIDRIAAYLGKRADEALKENKALLLLGDFNIVSPEHKTMKALLDNGFKVPKALSHKTNVLGTKYYDQIAFKTKAEVIDFIESSSDNIEKRNAGIVDILKNVFTPAQFELYKKEVSSTSAGKKKSGEELKKYYSKEWSTYQFSDHKPLWVRLKTNDSQDYLEKLKKRL